MNSETVQVLRSISSLRSVQAPMSIDLGSLPHASLSFANAGEDMALRKLLKHRIARRQGGMYLDIGCAAPISISNSYLFYCLGWRGVCVDPNPEATPYWKESRPEDVFINAAVGEREGSTRLFLHKSNLGMHVISDTPPSDEYAGDTVVPVRRLDNILAEHAKGREIQFLSLDVEGAELGVLKSNAWDIWRPEYILIEVKDFDMLAPRNSETINYLLELGYTLDSKVSENVILRRRLDRLPQPLGIIRPDWLVFQVRHTTAPRPNPNVLETSLRGMRPRRE